MTRQGFAAMATIATIAPVRTAMASGVFLTVTGSLWTAPAPTASGEATHSPLARKPAVLKGRPALVRVCLLPRHDGTHGGFVVLDQVAADVNDDLMQRAGELEGRLVVGRDGGALLAPRGDAAAERDE